MYVMLCSIWYRLYNFKKVKNMKLLKPATLLKVTHFHGCYSRFLNLTNDTKSPKASYILKVISCNEKSL